MRGKIERLEGLVVVTGASSGIGRELALRAAKDGVDLVLAGDQELSAVIMQCRTSEARSVESVECDLATEDGVLRLVETIGDRPVSALIANAGHGGDVAFLDQDWGEARHIIATNITGTIRLIQLVGLGMRERDKGRILITGSIAGHMPGAFQLVYNSTKAFINDFANGLRNELKDTGVAVTCLEPGVTDTDFFARAHMLDTKAGKGEKADPSRVAEDGYAAMLAEEAKVVSGFMNKVQALFADILPESVVAQMHRRLAEPEKRKTAEVSGE